MARREGRSGQQTRTPTKPASRRHGTRGVRPADAANTQPTPRPTPRHPTRWVPASVPAAAREPGRAPSPPATSFSCSTTAATTAPLWQDEPDGPAARRPRAACGGGAAVASPPRAAGVGVGVATATAGGGVSASRQRHATTASRTSKMSCNTRRYQKKHTARPLIPTKAPPDAPTPRHKGVQRRAPGSDRRGRVAIEISLTRFRCGDCVGNRPLHSSASAAPPPGDARSPPPRGGSRAAKSMSRPPRRSRRGTRAGRVACAARLRHGRPAAAWRRAEGAPRAAAVATDRGGCSAPPDL